MLPDYPIRNRETQTSSTTYTFGREKRIIDFHHVFRGDANSRVRNLDSQQTIFAVASR